MMGNRQIAYLWVPNFGATVARRANPALRDRPLALLDEHGQVLAADALAMQAGVVSGLTEQQAAARCSEATILPAARFPLWEAQETLLERVKDYTDHWQPDGLGRVYLVAAEAAPARNVGLRDTIDHQLISWCAAVTDAARRLGWQPALGATGSKFGASVAGQAAWQDAALLLAPAAQQAFLAVQPAATLPLDADALIQLRYLGIRTLGQYAALPAVGVLARFGPAGRLAQRWAQGLDDRPVISPWEVPEVAARIEFETPLADQERLLAALVRQAERLLAPLRERLQAIGRLLLAVTRTNGRVVQVAHTFSLPTAAAEPVRLALTMALARVAWDQEGAAEITLTLADVTDAPAQQLTLFDMTPDGRARLRATLDRLAARFGPDTFRLAILADPTNVLPERRVGWQTFR